MWKKACKSCMGLFLSGMILAGTAFAAPSGGENQQTVKEDPKGEKKIVINIASHSLALYQGGKKIRLYPLGLGKPSTPTPTGYYKINSKDVNPTWIDPSDPEVVVPSGESNPLGYRWMLLYGHYGIHGTNRPDSIGTYASNGCIRMNEKDVEALFDLVDIGTPVEITYNRIVVEKIEDDTVVYYIYPDGYDRQPLSVEMVDQWLSGYGINAFESNEAIEKKIAASDGEPTYIGKVYSILLDGKKLSAKAVIVDGVAYLPVSDVALALGLDAQWKPEDGTVITPYGMAKGYHKKNVLYFNALDMGPLFHVEGGLNENRTFVLRTKAAAPAVTAPAPAATVQPPAETAKAPATTAAPAVVAPSPNEEVRTSDGTGTAPVETSTAPATAAPSPAESVRTPDGTVETPAAPAAAPAVETPSPAEANPSPAPTEPMPETKTPSAPQTHDTTTVNRERESLPADKRIIQPADGLEDVH